MLRGVAASGGGITIGTSTITGGTDTYVLYNNAGVVGNASTLRINSTAGQGPSIVAGTATTAVNALNITQTWNEGSTTFTGIFANVTSSASGGSSLLMDLQLGGVSQFKVGKAGVVTSPTTFISTATGTVGFLAAGQGKVNMALGGAGTNFGQISNIDQHTWSVGYGSSASTIGTNAITWTDNGAITLSPNTGNVTVSAGTVNIAVGGSTTISTGVGSVKMTTGNAATNTSWIPIAYAGTTYFVPGWTTNSP